MGKPKRNRGSSRGTTEQQVVAPDLRTQARPSKEVKQLPTWAKISPAQIPKRLDQIPGFIIRRLSPINAAIFSAGVLLGAAVVAYETQTQASPVGQDPHRPSERSTKKSIWKRTPPGNLAEHLPFGSPGPFHDLLRREAYVTAYDRRLKHPAWTAQHLTAANLRRPPATDAPPRIAPPALAPPMTVPDTPQVSHPSSPPPPLLAVAPSQNVNKTASTAQTTPAEAVPKTGGDRLRSAFIEDPSVAEPFRAKLADYVDSGYDRGHMVPAADARRNQSAMDETFLLTNIAPQVGQGFNRQYWAWFEDFCRKLTNSFQDVYVFTVPLYLPKRDPKDGKWRVSYEVIGPPSLAPSVSVPTHFSKVILAKNDDEHSMAAFVLPNDKIADHTPLESFLVPVDSVERAAGLTIFTEEIKTRAKPLCGPHRRCEVLVRYFDEAGNIDSKRSEKRSPPSTVKEESSK